MNTKQLFQAIQPFIRQDVAIAVTENTKDGEIMGVSIVTPDGIISHGVQTLNPSCSDETTHWTDIGAIPHWSEQGPNDGSYNSYWLQKAVKS